MGHAGQSVGMRSCVGGAWKLGGKESRKGQEFGGMVWDRKKLRKGERRA